MAKTIDEKLARQIERRLNYGVKNLWYPILPSWQVRENPVGITRLGERIAVWRGTDGAIHAVEDRCPHRGARLSQGWNLGDRLACWYHGVQIDGNGVTCEVPAVDKCPWKGKQRIRNYPVVERNDAIFAWFGDELHPEPAELKLPEEMESDGFSGFLCLSNWKCNYRYAIDNVMDPMHGAYLHSASHTMAWGEKKAVMSLDKTDTGFLFEKKDQTGENFDWVEFGNTGTHWLRLSIPYRANVGPGGHFFIIGFATPIDDERCQVYFWRIRKISGWQRDLWRFLYKNRLEGRHWDVLEEDRTILEAMASDAREHENLYQHDKGLTRIRFELQKEAKTQVEALQAAASAAG